jgi:hypothetical protein
MTDSSGYGNVCSCTSCPGLSDDLKGNQDSAYWFNGVDDVFDCGNDLSLNPNYLTLAMWVNPESFPASGSVGLIAKGDNANRQYWAWVYQTDLSLEIGEGTHQNNVVDLNIGTWYHIAITYDGAEVIAYKDGVEVFSVPQASGPILTDNDPLLIGNLPGFGFFNGIIDDVRVYNRSLNPAEISAIYQDEACHRADKACDDCIDNNEIIWFIGDWKQGLGGITMTELMDGIRIWKAGQGCP